MYAGDRKLAYTFFLLILFDWVVPSLRQSVTDTHRATDHERPRVSEVTAEWVQNYVNSRNNESEGKCLACCQS